MNSSSIAPRPVRIAQITDFHLLTDPAGNMMGVNTDQSLLAVLDFVCHAHDRIDLFLATGDLAQEPTVATYRRLAERLAELPAVCYCLPGNHDDPRLIRQVLVEGSIACQSQILLEAWQIICLDSTIPDDAGGYLSAEQLALLEQCLVRYPERHALVCLHHSPIPTGSAWLDTMTVANGEEFLALVERFPQVKGVACGHIHQAMDVTRGALRLLGCPSTCFQFKPASDEFALEAAPQGYRWIELHADGRIVSEVLRMDFVPPGLNVASSGY